jgi:hypothetical protein
MARMTPMRTDDFQGQPRWCTQLASSPLLSPLLTSCLQPNARPLPPGWRREGDEASGAPSRLVLPPQAHPFWRSADAAEQTTAMFESVSDEKDAVSAELATTLVRGGGGAAARRGGAGAHCAGGARLTRCGGRCWAVRCGAAARAAGVQGEHE